MFIVRFIAKNIKTGKYYNYLNYSGYLDKHDVRLFWHDDIKKARSFHIPQHAKMSLKGLAAECEIIPVKLEIKRKNKGHLWAEKELQKLGLSFNLDNLPSI